MSRHRWSALRLATISVALAVPLAGAWADDASVELARIMQDNANRQAVIEIAREQNKHLPDGCNSVTYTETSRRVVLSSPQVDRSGKLTGGTWLQSVIATGCGTKRQLNILTLAQRDGTLRRIALLPGTTIADPLLQQDAVKYALAATVGLMRDCQTRVIVETRFVEFEGAPLSTVGGQVVRPWREDWRAEGCGKRVVVPVHFNPDPSGTTIRASSKEAHAD
jgi:hypothetical protein